MQNSSSFGLKKRSIFFTILIWNYHHRFFLPSVLLKASFLGTDEDKFVQVFTQRSFPHLKVVFQEYKKVKLRQLYWLCGTIKCSKTKTKQPITRKQSELINSKKKQTGWSAGKCYRLSTDWFCIWLVERMARFFFRPITRWSRIQTHNAFNTRWTLVQKIKRSVNVWGWKTSKLIARERIF